MPIFKVTTPTETRYVEAEKKTQAINHVIRQGVEAESLSPDQLLAVWRSGGKIETAGFEVQE